MCWKTKHLLQFIAAQLRDLGICGPLAACKATRDNLLDH
jgi:hypothetical protein